MSKKLYSARALPKQPFARAIWRAKNKAAAFARTTKILQLAEDDELSSMDMLGEAIGAERLHRILAHGANTRDVKVMRDFVRLRRDWRIRRTISKAMQAAGEQRQRELEARRAAYRRRRSVAELLGEDQ